MQRHTCTDGAARRCKLTLMTANLCLPDGSGNTVVPVPTCVVSLAICYPLSAQLLLRAGANRSLVGCVLLASLVLGLSANSALMHVVHRFIGPPTPPSDGKAAMAYTFNISRLWSQRSQSSLCKTTTSEELTTWFSESFVVLVVPIAVISTTSWVFEPDNWFRQVILCVEVAQLCLLLFAWVAQTLTWIATVLDLWFTRQYKEERIDLLIAHIAQVSADVVCLQEAIPMVWCSEYMERYGSHGWVLILATSHCVMPFVRCCCLAGLFRRPLHSGWCIRVHHRRDLILGCSL